MKRSEIPFMPEFFDRYINRVADIELLDALSAFDRFETIVPAETLTALGDSIYAPGKWMMKDIVQHMIDTERIMSYRALRFARNDQTTLPGFDEDLFSTSAHAATRSLEDLLDEFAVVRQATIVLFKSFDEEMLLRTGICFNKRVSVLAIGFILVGHPIHHGHVIQERYLPLLSA